LTPWSERAAESLARLAEGSAVLAPAAAFLGGALTALNPCVLAMIPLMVGFAAGIAGKGVEASPGRRLWPRTLGFSLLFVVGFAVELALLFTVFSSAAAWLSASWWQYVLAGICAFLGLHLLGVIRIPPVQAPAALSRTAGAAGALLFGFLFGIISLPCTGPVLLLLIGLVPQIGPARAGLLLFLYGLGHSLLILFAGTFVGVAATLIGSSRVQIAARRLRQCAGVLILFASAWMFLR
jgi:cytochrome c-type biogenesis protein